MDWQFLYIFIAKYLKKQTVKFETFILLWCSQFSTFLQQTGNAYSLNKDQLHQLPYDVKHLDGRQSIFLFFPELKFKDIS